MGLSEHALRPARAMLEMTAWVHETYRRSEAIATARESRPYVGSGP
jgi:hypothetical protein